ncbi:hypothetical protein DFH27DRAFT_527163 [Peziza echinospora]|nr:hypothetical protein DFH27DRAFT_527163 [Peziza echinospora]
MPRRTTSQHSGLRNHPSKKASQDSRTPSRPCPCRLNSPASPEPGHVRLDLLFYNAAPLAPATITRATAFLGADPPADPCDHPLTGTIPGSPKTALTLFDFNCTHETALLLRRIAAALDTTIMPMGAEGCGMTRVAVDFAALVTERLGPPITEREYGVDGHSRAPSWHRRADVLANTESSRALVIRVWTSAWGGRTRGVSHNHTRLHRTATAVSAAAATMQSSDKLAPQLTPVHHVLNKFLATAANHVATPDNCTGFAEVVVKNLASSKRELVLIMFGGLDLEVRRG